mmetsp:Transcript_11141/g.35517  ORF Transcript_11141/g.35517 Transcript_11141/m.35517 type:complete len:242 (+) Transcript_11141:307-1032(+)
MARATSRRMSCRGSCRSTQNCPAVSDSWRRAWKQIRASSALPPQSGSSSMSVSSSSTRDRPWTAETLALRSAMTGGQLLSRHSSTMRCTAVTTRVSHCVPNPSGSCSTSASTSPGRSCTSSLAMRMIAIAFCVPLLLQDDLSAASRPRIAAALSTSSGSPASPSSISQKLSAIFRACDSRDVAQVGSVGGAEWSNREPCAQPRCRNPLLPGCGGRSALPPSDSPTRAASKSGASLRNTGTQ